MDTHNPQCLEAHPSTLAGRATICSAEVTVRAALESAWPRSPTKTLNLKRLNELTELQMMGKYTIIVFIWSHYNDKADIWLSAAETTFAVAASTDRTHTLMHSSSRCSQKPRLCLLPTRRPSDNLITQMDTVMLSILRLSGTWAEHHTVRFSSKLLIGQCHKPSEVITTLN